MNDILAPVPAATVTGIGTLRWRAARPGLGAPAALLVVGFLAAWFAATAFAATTAGGTALIGGLVFSIHDPAHVSVTSVPLGTVVHPRVDVAAGPFGPTPTGNVVFARFANGNCTGTPAAQSAPVTVGPGINPDAIGFTFTTVIAGSHWYKVTYSGDSYYAPFASSCRAITFIRINPTLQLRVHDDFHAVVTTVGPNTRIHGHVTVTGTQGLPTGQVTISQYANASCTGTAAATETKTLVGGRVEGTVYANLVSGTRTYRASYAGNGTYASITGTCASVAVSKIAPTLDVDLVDFIAQSLTTFPAGYEVRLVVGVSGSSGTPTGSVSYRRHAGSNCTELNPPTLQLSLSSGFASSAYWSHTNPGPYSIQVRYNGNTTYSTWVGCVNYTVTKATPTVSATVAHNASHGAILSVRAGASFHLTAAASGSVGTPTSTMTFTMWANPDCTGAQQLLGTTGLNASGVAETAPIILAAPHVYGVRATYNGDVRYLAKAGPCGTLTIIKANVTTNVTLHNPQHQVAASWRVGMAVHPHIGISGPVGIPTGTAGWAMYGTTNCSEPPIAVISGPLDATGWFNATTTFTLPSAGTFSHQFSYSGNTKYEAHTGACLPITVTKSTVLMAGAIHRHDNHQVVTTVPVGIDIHPITTITSAFGPATGSVTFKIWGNATCTGTAVAQTSEPIVAGVAHETLPLTFLTAVNRSYQFVYSGDGTYFSMTSPCVPLTVTKGDPGVFTVIHNTSHAPVTTVSVGDGVHPNVTIAGYGITRPGGTVTGAAYPNGTCSGSATFNWLAKTIVGGLADLTPSWAPIASGTFSVRVTYSGDANWLSKAGACIPFSVTKLTPTITTAVHNASHQSVTSVAVGTQVHARTLVEGFQAIPPTGTVTLHWWADAGCDSNEIQTQTVSLANGVAEAPAITSLVAAARSVYATYSGDGAYTGGPTNCASVTFTKIAGTIALEIHNAQHQVVTEVPVQSQVHQSVAVTGALSTPTGTVVLQWFTTPDCSGPASSTSAALALAGGALEATTFLASSAAPIAASGRATWSGDATYLGGLSPCRPITFNAKLASTSTLTIHDAAHGAVTSVPEGTPVHPRVIVTGSGPVPSGSVVFAWFDNGDCTGDPLVTSGPFGAGSGVSDASGFTQTPPTNGTYAFRVTYSGDAQYNGSTSPCAPLAVEFIGPSVLTFAPAFNPTGATSLAWTLTFDEPITGLAAADITLGGTSAGWAIDSVVGSGASWTIVTKAANPTAGSLLLTLAADSVVNGDAVSGPNEARASDPVTILPFSDITGSTFRNDIVWIWQEGITTGCGPRLYCPLGSVTRAQMASFLARALDLPPTVADYFDDDEGNTHEADINRLAEAGITGGCGPRRYCPGASVTRAQMASFLVRALGLTEGGDTDFFTDDDGSTHETDINRLRHAGITFGCTATTYCPTASVTRGQMAAFLRRSFEALTPG